MYQVFCKAYTYPSLPVYIHIYSGALTSGITRCTGVCVCIRYQNAYIYLSGITRCTGIARHALSLHTSGITMCKVCKGTNLRYVSSITSYRSMQHYEIYTYPSGITKNALGITRTYYLLYT